MKTLNYNILQYFNNKNNISKKFKIILILSIYLIYNNKNSYYFGIKNIFKFIPIQPSSFEFHNYQRHLITEKILKYSGIEQRNNEPYFLNGIIRKFKPRKCLEIGVARGGSSVVILNAIKDIDNSLLISLDINENLYIDQNKKTGYVVKTYFPELCNNKWQLFTGKQPHIFLSKLNLKFDFLFLDTVHLCPGELFNLIEVLPFLEDNAIIVLHDITFHFLYTPKLIKIHPSQIILMTSLMGDKIIIPNKKLGLENIGAIILFPNQEKYYLNYFLLLLTPWEYLQDQIFLKELRLFIKKYYKNEL